MLFKNVDSTELGTICDIIKLFLSVYPPKKVARLAKLKLSGPDQRIKYRYGVSTSSYLQNYFYLCDSNRKDV